MGLLQEVYSGRWAEYLRRTFLMRGQLRLQIPGDIQPVIDVTELGNSEHRDLGWRTFLEGRFVLAAAAQVGIVQLAVPAGARALCEVFAAWIATSNFMAVDFLHDGTALAAPAPIGDEDSRNPNWSTGANIGPVTIAGQTAAAPGGLGRGVIGVQAATVFPMLTTLHDGHNLTLAAESVNQNLFVSFLGRYRLLQPGEA